MGYGSNVIKQIITLFFVLSVFIVAGSVFPY